MDTMQESFSNLYDAIYGQKASYESRARVTAAIAQTINQCEILLAIQPHDPMENRSVFKRFLKSLFWHW